MHKALLGVLVDWIKPCTPACRGRSSASLPAAHWTVLNTSVWLWLDRLVRLDLLDGLDRLDRPVRLDELVQLDRLDQPARLVDGSSSYSRRVPAEMTRVNVSEAF